MEKLEKLILLYASDIQAIERVSVYSAYKRIKTIKHAFNIRRKAAFVTQEEYCRYYNIKTAKA